MTNIYLEGKLIDYLQITRNEDAVRLEFAFKEATVIEVWETKLLSHKVIERK